MLTSIEKKFLKKLEAAVAYKLIVLPVPIRGSTLSHKRAKRSIPASILSIIGKIFSFIIIFHVIFALTIALLCTIYTKVDPEFTTLMAYRKYYYGWNLTQRKEVNYASIPRVFKRMLVSVEDGSFYDHNGVSVEALLYAYNMDKKLGKPLYGGSTLTMQVARTMFLVPEKSYLRKYLELIIALEMDIIISKDRQLDLYFNYAEWGKGVFGVEAASKKYYKTSFKNLNLEAGARMITILSSPIINTPFAFQKNGILRERFYYLSRRYLN